MIVFRYPLHYISYSKKKIRGELERETNARGQMQLHEVLQLKLPFLAEEGEEEVLSRE